MEGIFKLSLLFAIITEINSNLRIQKCQLAHAIGNNIVLKFLGLLKNFRIRHKSNDGTGLIGFTLFLERLYRCPMLKLHHINFPITVDLRIKVRRKGIYTTHTYPVQTTRNLVGIFIELTAGVQFGKHNFNSG